MQNDSYTKEIVVNTSSEAVFEAIMRGIDKWWSLSSNKTEKEGDRLTVRFGTDKQLYMVMDLTKVIPNKSVHWSVIDDNIDVNGKIVKGEWVGTTVKFEIQRSNEGSKINFTHEGLVPALVCYEVCNSAWDYFLDSFKSYLNTGKGNPAG